MTRTRLVIAGDDLKFVAPLLPELERTCDVRIDRWSGPEGHDEAVSEELAAWADVVWCEWWLGNAVWYSWRLRPDQRLLIRLHLFELTREYLHLTNLDALDRVVCVSIPTWADLRRTIALPPGIACVVPNAVAFDDFASAVLPSAVDEEAEKIGRDSGWSTNPDPYLSGELPGDRLRSLALIGAVPARKGLHRALMLLAELSHHDPRYELHVYGQRPADLPWVAEDPEQQAYYAHCDALIADEGLADAVIWHGWTEMTSALPQHGFVLSPSDFESFHVAPVEGAAAGAVPIVWRWPGVRWSHPESVLVGSDVGMTRAAGLDAGTHTRADGDPSPAAGRILDLADASRHAQASAEALAWYRARCTPADVASQLMEVFGPAPKPRGPISNL